MPDADDAYPGQDGSATRILRICHLLVIVTGVLVADLDDLTSVIHAAMAAYEMRTLGLMALGAFHGRDRA
jgi:hypothetical protein